jgi:uncharacterized membrane protein YgcG
VPSTDLERYLASLAITAPGGDHDHDDDDQDDVENENADGDRSAPVAHRPVNALEGCLLSSDGAESPANETPRGTIWYTHPVVAALFVPGRAEVQRSAQRHAEAVAAERARAEAKAVAEAEAEAAQEGNEPVKSARSASSRPKSPGKARPKSPGGRGSARSAVAAAEDDSRCDAGDFFFFFFFFFDFFSILILTPLLQSFNTSINVMMCCEKNAHVFHSTNHSAAAPPAIPAPLSMSTAWISSRLVCFASSSDLLARLSARAGTRDDHGGDLGALCIDVPAILERWLAVRAQQLAVAAAASGGGGGGGKSSARGSAPNSSRSRKSDASAAAVATAEADASAADAAAADLPCPWVAGAVFDAIMASADPDCIAAIEEARAANLADPDAAVCHIAHWAIHAGAAAISDEGNAQTGATRALALVGFPRNRAQARFLLDAGLPPRRLVLAEASASDTACARVAFPADFGNLSAIDVAAAVAGAGLGLGLGNGASRHGHDPASNWASASQVIRTVLETESATRTLLPDEITARTARAVRNRAACASAVCAHACEWMSFDPAGTDAPWFTARVRRFVAAVLDGTAPPALPPVVAAPPPAVLDAELALLAEPLSQLDAPFPLPGELPTDGSSSARKQQGKDRDSRKSKGGGSGGGGGGNAFGAPGLGDGSALAALANPSRPLFAETQVGDRHWRVSPCSIDRFTATALAEAVPLARSLRSLVFTGCVLNGTMIAAICDAVARSRSVEVLGLDGCAIDLAAARGIARTILPRRVSSAGLLLAGGGADAAPAAGSSRSGSARDAGAKKGGSGGGKKSKEDLQREKDAEEALERMLASAPPLRTLTLRGCGLGADGDVECLSIILGIKDHEPHDDEEGGRGGDSDDSEDDAGDEDGDGGDDDGANGRGKGAGGGGSSKRGGGGGGGKQGSKKGGSGGSGGGAGAPDATTDDPTAARDPGVLIGGITMLDLSGNPLGPGGASIVAACLVRARPTPIPITTVPTLEDDTAGTNADGKSSAASSGGKRGGKAAQPKVERGETILKLSDATAAATSPAAARAEARRRRRAAAAAARGAALERPTLGATLTHLSLAGCGIGDSGARIVAQSLWRVPLPRAVEQNYRARYQAAVDARRAERRRAADAERERLALLASGKAGKGGKGGKSGAAGGTSTPSSARGKKGGSRAGAGGDGDEAPVDPFAALEPIETELGSHWPVPGERLYSPGNRLLVSLNLDGCDIGYDGATWVARCTARNTTLARVSLDGNRIPREIEDVVLAVITDRAEHPCLVEQAVRPESPPPTPPPVEIVAETPAGKGGAKGKAITGSAKRAGSGRIK